MEPLKCPSGALPRIDTWPRRLLLAVALGYLALFLALPVAFILIQALAVFDTRFHRG